MLNEKLKELRENQGLNKKEFANFLGLKYTTYNNYETGLREPSSDFLILVSEKLNVSIDYLLGLKDDKDILHSYKLLSEEYDHIKKYRELDDHGKEMVDIVLDKEHDRVLSVHVKSDLLAAHAHTDVPSGPVEVRVRELTPATLAAHFDGKEYTDDEMNEIRHFAKSVKNSKVQNK